MQIRPETHLVDKTARLIAAVKRFGIGHVIFNDHLDEGQDLARLDAGLRADKVDINAATRVIAATIAGGGVIYLVAKRRTGL